jgi:hypothetical protein
MMGTYGSDISKCLVLLAGTGNREEEDEDPWDADFGPHLKADGPNSGVQGSTHEVVVEKVAWHAHGVAGHDRPDIGDQWYTEAVDHRDGHEVTVVVDDLGEAEDMVVVQDTGSDQGHVEADESIAVVVQCLVVQGRHGETFLGVARHDKSNEQLEKEVARVDLPGVGVRTRILVVC